MLAEIGHALDALEADDRLKAIVLIAEGKHVCAGADFAFLDELSSMSAVTTSKQGVAAAKGKRAANFTGR